MRGTGEDARGVQLLALGRKGKGTKVQAWMQVRRELDTRKRGPRAKAAGSRRAGDVLRKQDRQREGPGDRAGGRGPEQRRQARRAEPAQGRAAAGAPTRTRGAAGGPSAAPGAEAEAAASSCSGRPGQAASSSRPPSLLSQAAKLLPPPSTHPAARGCA